MNGFTHSTNKPCCFSKHTLLIRGVSSSRWKFIVLDLVVPLLVTAGLTWFLASNNRDLEIQRAAFDADTGSWAMGKLPFWKAVYDFGPLPAEIVGIGGLFVFVFGFKFAKLARFRRASIYLFLVAAVAGGIIANLILKEHWGRPRPREVDEFGGRYPFEEVLTIDPISDGKSFPCGHATMGFFFVALYFLLRKARPGWSIVALVIGLGFGGVLGIARILQGGHFASDVVWAGAVTFFTATGLFYLLKLNRSVLDEPTTLGKRKIPLKIKLFGIAAIASGITAVMLATPYSDKRNYTILSEVKSDAPLRLSLHFIHGDIKIVPGDEFSIRGEAWGHGVPTSKIADKFVEKIEDDGSLRIRYSQRWSGKLTEVNQRLTVTIPWERVRYLKLTLLDAEAVIDLPKLENGPSLQLITERAKLTGRLANGVTISTFIENESKIDDEKAGGQVHYFKSVPKSGTAYRLEWKEVEASKLIFEKAKM